MKANKSDVDVFTLLQAWMLAHSIAEAKHNAQLMELVVADHLQVMTGKLMDTRTSSQGEGAL